MRCEVKWVGFFAAAAFVVDAVRVQLLAGLLVDNVVHNVLQLSNFLS
jgi:hypothetical protein